MSAALAQPAPKTAFEPIYRANFAAVWSWLRRMGVPRGQREDFAQQTFEIALRGFERFDGARPVRPWLFGIAFRVVVAARRTLESKQAFVDEAVEVVDPNADLEHRAAQRQARELLWRGLQSLNVDQRAVFTLVELEGLSMPEAVEALGIPLNTGYSRLRLAREALTEFVRTGGGR